MLGLLGKKLGQTRVYDDKGVLIPVTIVLVGPNRVIQCKTQESDGYNAVQLGFGARKTRNATKGESNHAKKAGLEVTPRVLNEVRLTEAYAGKPGDVITVTAFTEGQIIDVLGVTKGKSFQGVVKRFRVNGGPAAHGSMFHRRIGSIGMRQTPGRVWKNQSMPGHMGSESRTVQNLRVVKIIADKNLILVKGAIPGANGDDVIIRSGKKAKPAKKA